jgi:outer membrane lipoprotein-sorting protein
LAARPLTRQNAGKAAKSPQAIATDKHGRELEQDMAAAGRAALLGALILVWAPAPVFAQAGPPASVSQKARPQAKSTAVRPKPTTTGQAGKTVKPGETLALDDNQRALIDRVSLYLSTINTLVGHFVQVGPDGSKSEGQFYIAKPGRVRFEYNPPNPIDITADGRQVSVRNRNLETQDLFPLSQTPLRFLLSERIDLRRETNVVGVYSDDIFATVVIEEKQPLIGTSRLMMMFDAKNLQLKQWTVTDAQGFDTTVAVSNLDLSTRPDPSIFTIDTSSKKN